MLAMRELAVSFSKPLRTQVLPPEVAITALQALPPKLDQGRWALTSTKGFPSRR